MDANYRDGARYRLLSFFLFLCMLFLLPACGDNSSDSMPKVSVVQTKHIRAAKCNEIFAEPLILRAKKSSGDGMSGVELTIKAHGGSELMFRGSEDSDFQPEMTAKTNENGEVRLFVKAGRLSGDQYADVYLESDSNTPVRTVRFLAGITVTGENQEAPAGGTTPEPLKITLTGPDGKPVIGKSLTYSMKNPVTGKLEIDELLVKTDKSGSVQIQPQLGMQTGKYPLKINIQEAGYDSFMVSEMSLNLSRLLINVLGGLAIFIFGMKMMSDGLHIAAGEKMKSLLRFFASNRVVAILAGTLVTTVLQSSSASTVMVIGFVNAGLLSLEQSIGIIFGANIGKAVVTQLVAFNMSGVILPCIILGLMVLFISWQKLRGWGETLLGFGFLFMGMGMMSSEMKPLRDFNSFTEFFRTFQCMPECGGAIPFLPLIGAIGIGILVTIVVQSSFPTTTIVIALCGSGLLDIYASIAIVLGANIGTTITAQLASIPANRVAKQAALAHSLFNVLGVLFVLPFFWIKWSWTGKPLFPQLVDWLTPGDIFAETPQNIPHYIVNAHMYFNILTTIVLFAFIPLLAKICIKIIPLGEKKIKFVSLEPHLLETPSLALEQTGITLRKMLKKAWKMIDTASVNCFIPCCVDTAAFESLDKKEQKIDELQVEITSYLTQIMSRHLNKEQARVIPQLMHCTNDAERIADHTENIISLTKRLQESGKQLSGSAILELTELHTLLKEQAFCTLSALAKYDFEQVKTALDNQKKIDEAAKIFEENHIHRLEENVCDPITGVIFIEFIAELAKVSSHLTNIAERARKIGSNYTNMASELRKKNVSAVKQSILSATANIPLPADNGDADDDK